MPQEKKIIIQVIAAAIVGIIVGVAIGYNIAAPAPGGVGKALPKRIPIGGLFALTGPLSSYGNRHKIAVEMAIEDINKYVAKLGYDVEFCLVAEDTTVSPEEALKDMQTLATQGVKVFVGPLASSEVEAIKSFADEKKLVVISHSSTAPSLAISGDYIFRFVPTDAFQGKALATLAWTLGLRKVAVLYRGNNWGEGLYLSFKENFEALGGEVKAVKYSPDAKELSAEIRRLSDIVKSFGAGSDVGVLLISYEDDGVAALVAAKEDETLTSVVWLGCDGTAKSKRIAEDVGDVAVRVGGLFSTIFSPTSSPRKEEFERRFRSRAGEDPDPYAYNIYDATWVLALAIIEAGTYDGEAIQKVLPDVAARYFGVSGWTLLDENGDRAGGDYVIYKIVEAGGKYEWKAAGIYSFTTNSVQWFED